MKMPAVLSERIEMTVKFHVTESQALALEAMFHYWNWLAAVGSTRAVAFYCDGDGNFKPKCTVTYDREMPALTDEMKKRAVVSDVDGTRVYDFDPIAWMLRKQREANGLDPHSDSSA